MDAFGRLRRAVDKFSVTYTTPEDANEQTYAP